MSRSRLLKMLAATGLVGLCMQVNAGTVTLVAPNVTYQYDDGQAALALFGAPILVGNNLIFTPTTFRAESLNGAGVDGVNATFVVDLFANDGFVLTDTDLAEAGDYFISGGDGSVFGGGLLQAVSLDADAPGFATDLLSFSDLTSVGSVTEWDADAAIDFVTAFGDTISGVRLTLENNLSATTLNIGEQAWIEKKFGEVGITPTTIPVPAALWLLASGLGLLSVLRRRKT